MRHVCRGRWPGALIGALVIGLGVAGVACAGVARQVTAAKLTVTLTDTKLVLSQSGLQAGTATFVVVNKGQKLHVLTINGPGLKGVRTRTVAVGRSATLTVKLLTGAYMLSDPVGLGTTNVRWLVVSPARSASGNGRAGAPPSLSDTTGMNCTAE
jgi:hypothetical protein